MQLNLPPQRYFIVVAIIGSLLFAIFTFALYRQSMQRDNYLNWTQQNSDAVRYARLINNDVTDMETGQRGYLLTHSKEFLQPYTSGLQNVYDTLDQLQASPAINADQKKQVLELRGRITVLISELQAQIARFDNPHAKPITVRDMRALKLVMDDVRDRVEQFINTGRNIVKARTESTRRQQKRYLSILFIGAAMSIGGLLLATLILMRVAAGRRVAETELSSARETYRLLLENLNDGIYDYTPATGEVNYSPSYAHMLGYEYGEIPATIEGVSGLIHPDDRAARWLSFERYIKHESPSYSAVFRLRHKDDGWRWILSRGVGTWDEQGNLDRMLGIHTDITAQKQREEELLQVNNDLESFIYITSHDLRAPLVNLKGFAGEITHSLDAVGPALKNCFAAMDAPTLALMHEAFEVDIPEALGFISSSVERMDALTTAILDLSRIGRRQFTMEAVDTNAMVRRCLGSLAYEINQKKVHVEYEALPTVVSDAIALEQIFGNILDNAVKYLDPARPGALTITASQSGWDTLFSIRDNGRGIAEADYRKVFDIFRRAGNSGNVRGAGMGMAYVKALVRRIGGRIWFESTLGQGTAFHFSIPVSPTVADAHADTQEEPA